MLSWLKKKDHNVCACGAKIDKNEKFCEGCAGRAQNMVQGWLCKDNGHLFMIFCVPIREEMSKDVNDYMAQQCPICGSDNIVEQEVRRG